MLLTQKKNNIDNKKSIPRRVPEIKKNLTQLMEILKLTIKEVNSLKNEISKF